MYSIIMDNEEKIKEMEEKISNLVQHGIKTEIYYLKKIDSIITHVLISNNQGKGGKLNAAFLFRSHRWTFWCRKGYTHQEAYE
jgi:hypothetical protein